MAEMTTLESDNNPTTQPQGAGYAGLAAVAPPAPCQPPQTPIQILRLPEVMARVGLCRASIYRHVAAGMFPKSISLGPRSVGWLEHEIDAWLAAKIQARNETGNFKRRV